MPGYNEQSLRANRHRRLYPVMLVLSWPVETQQASELDVVRMQPSLYRGNVRALDRAEDHERGFDVGDRLPGLAQVFPGIAQIAEGVALAVAVADLARDRKPLLVELDRLPDLAQGRPGNAQIAEDVALAAAVADLARDREGLLVELDR